MNKQLEISFLSPSPINTLKLTGQNRKLFDWLMAGNNIHCMSEDRMRLGIGYLNSRCADLKKLGVKIMSKFIEVEGHSGEKTSVKLYWIPEEFRKQVKEAA